MEISVDVASELEAGGIENRSAGLMVEGNVEGWASGYDSVVVSCTVVPLTSSLAVSAVLGVSATADTGPEGLMSTSIPVSAPLD